MIMFALLNGFLARNSGIDSWGHLGGFVFGLLISLIILQSAVPD
jgi:membrane associated rhomboid family serine protease